MTVFRNEGRWDTSNVEFRDGRILAYDKAHARPAMRYIDYGLGILDRRAFDVVPESGLVTIWPSVYQEMLSAGRARGVRGHGAVLRDRLGGGARGDADVTWPSHDSA